MDSRSQLMEISGPSLLIGLSRWTILHPLINKCQNPQEESQYAQLHLSILETVADLKKPMFVPNKAMISLISKLEDTLNRTGMKKNYLFFAAVYLEPHRLWGRPNLFREEGDLQKSDVT